MTIAAPPYRIVHQPTKLITDGIAVAQTASIVISKEVPMELATRIANLVAKGHIKVQTAQVVREQT